MRFSPKQTLISLTIIAIAIAATWTLYTPPVFRLTAVCPDHQVRPGEGVTIRLAVENSGSCPLADLTMSLGGLLEAHGEVAELDPAPRAIQTPLPGWRSRGYVLKHAPVLPGGRLELRLLYVPRRPCAFYDSIAVGHRGVLATARKVVVRLRAED